ncbi:DUF3460 family protein [Azovibrio restrictus]|uniref:DUF3460 family protein n=1 Tax=Azovibrio restrictus TaxID=146938 RepID=UPI0026EBC202|nr:DUF3460 family protein [Azovibrio restrictus]MDD3484704.1 DUF3460 family protein [Azovibrio restrictus]
MGIVDSSYESDHTKWMREMMAKNPEWAQEQEAGRALWWDKKQEPGLCQDFAKAKECQKPYPYDVNFFGE